MTIQSPKNNVKTLPPSGSWSPEQALAAANRVEFKKIMILGYDKDGKYVQLSSAMTKEQMLWLSENARHSAIN